MKQRDQLLRGVALVLRMGRVGNGLFFGAIVAGLAGSWAFHGFYRAMLVQADPGVDVAAALLGIRLLMLIGVAMTIATDRLLVPLASIVARAEQGDPFVPANAARLRQIGWALLALQMLDVPAQCWRDSGRASVRPRLPATYRSAGGWRL